MLFGRFDKVKMFRFKLGRDTVMIRYPELPTFVQNYSIYVLVSQNFYCIKSNGRIAMSVSKNIRKEIYKQPVYTIEVNNVRTFHALQKEFTLFKRYTTFKRYKNVIKVLNLPTEIINKIAWYCV